MRRRAIALAALAATGTAAVMGSRRRRRAAGTARAPSAPTEIAPGVFCLGPTGRTQTNVYLVRDGATWFLVDAGWAADALRIDAGVRSLVGPGALPAAILLTHVHPDHSGSARQLAMAWGCPVLAHPDEIPIAAGDFAEMERVAGPLDRWAILPLMRAMGERRRTAALARGSFAGLVRALDPDGSIPGVGGWRWIATPGHTPGHVSFVRPADGVALTGDALLTLSVNEPAGILLGRGGLSGPPWYTTWDAGTARASIAGLAALEPEIVGPGHGRPLAGPGTAAAVRAFARRG